MSQLSLQQATRLTGPRRATRKARIQDVPAIRAIVEPLARQQRMVAVSPVTFYESLQRFRVIETPEQGVIGCGALQVVWDELAEIRTIAISPDRRGSGAGSALLRDLLHEGRQLGVRRVFCQTFAVDFFMRHGFVPSEVESISPEIYSELLRCYDHHTAQSLDLVRVRPLTLGNTCMVRTLVTLSRNQTYLGGWNKVRESPPTCPQPRYPDSAWGGEDPLTPPHAFTLKPHLQGFAALHDSGVVEA